MKKMMLGVVALSLTTTLVGCKQEEKPAEKLVLNTSAEKASYGMGMNIGRSFEHQQFEVSTAALTAGILDIMGKKEPMLTKEQVDEAFAEIRDEIRKKKEEESLANAEKAKTFLADNAKKDGIVVLDSGLQYQVLSAGTGSSPKATDVVKTHYHGTLIDGTVFDSSVDRGEPAEFPVNRVIPGWTEALQQMKVGDKWKLFIPSELAYGKRSPSPKIPANSALIFEVELLEVKESEGIPNPHAAAQPKAEGHGHAHAGHGQSEESKPAAEESNSDTAESKSEESAEEKKEG